MFDYEEHRKPSEKKATMQAKRKVVHKEGPSIEGAILWDNQRKCYFKNMRPRKNSAKYIYGRRMGNILGGLDEAKGHFDYMKQMYVDDSKKDSKKHSEKDRIGLNEVLLEFDENHFVEANKRDMKVYDGGERVPEQEEPFAIRLYAEGNMDHASGLAAGMEEYLTRAVENPVLPIDRMRDRKVLIKATEFRSLDDVAEAYGPSSGQRPALYKYALRTRLAQSTNLEGSFGGSTGDMTRSVTNTEPRTYDLIQATFFWLQGYKQSDLDAEVESIKQNIRQLKRRRVALETEIAELPVKEQEQKAQKEAELAALIAEIEEKERERRSIYTRYYKEGNEESYEMMIRFVRNQLRKLKQNGEIRIVVSNANPYAEIRKRLTDKAIAGEEADNPLYKNIKIEVCELPKIYPQKLAEEGLNAVGFEQRQTRKLSTVGAANGKNPIANDLIIIIRKGR